MGSLFAYSGLTTKLKAMQGKLIKEDGYDQLIRMNSVQDIVSFLKSQPSYAAAFEDVDALTMHRGTMEKILNFSKYSDFVKIYNFSTIRQRKFLNLYFIKYETTLVKRAFRGLDYCSDSTYYDKLADIISSYTTVDISKVIMARNSEELMEVLVGAPYYKSLAIIHDSYNDKNEEQKLFDYEMALDLFFFRYLWKKKDKYFSKQELKCIQACVGSEVDMLNIVWIYRAKKYYNMSEEAIWSLIIPIYYKLSQEDIQSLLVCDIQEIHTLISKTYYGKNFDELVGNGYSYEKSYNQVLDRLYNKFFRSDPYSLSAINAYLHNKEREINKLITITECVRYKYSPEDIIQHII